MGRPDEKLSDLKALWNRKRGGLSMPARSQFATRDLQPWYGNLALIDLSSRSIRLCGTNLISRFGRDATGWDIASLDEAVVASVTPYIDRAQAAKAPIEDVHNRIVDGYLVSYRELALPLSDDADHVTMILFGSYPIGARPAWQ
jgi:hypothetical protein